MALTIEQKKHYANLALKRFWSSRFVYYSSKMPGTYQEFLDKLNFDSVLQEPMRLDDWFHPLGERVNDIITHPQGGEGAIRLAMDGLSKQSPNTWKGGFSWRTLRLKIDDAVAYAVINLGPINLGLKATVKAAGQVWDLAKYIPYIVLALILAWAYFEFRVARKMAS